MKAGIYKRRDNGLHVYIAKDRSILASERSSRRPDAPHSFMHDRGTVKVSTSEKEKVARWSYETIGVEVVADRVADAPNGCKDHARALADYAARSVVEKHGPKDVRLVSPDLIFHVDTVEAEKHSAERQQRMWVPLSETEILQDCSKADGRPNNLFDKKIAELHTDNTTLAYEKLGAHPPAVQTEQPATDLTDSEPATPDFAERAQAQVDTVVAYEKAKRDLQLMLLCEQSGVVQWTGDDWEILDNDAWNLTQIAPTKLLPVLPRGWVAERAAAYCGNARANSPLDRGLKQAMAVVLGNERRFHTGGYTGEGPGGVPAILDTCVMRGREMGRPAALAAPYGSAMPEWAAKLPAGAANFAKSVEIYHIEKHARHIGDAFRMQFQQLSHSFEAWRDYEFRMVLAHIVEAAEVYQDEVTVIDPIRFDNLEEDVRDGRYKNIGTHIVDGDTDKQYPVSVEQRAIIKHLLDAKPNYIVTSGSADPIPAELQGRRYWKVPSERAQALAKLKKGELLNSEDWAMISDDPAECVALAAIATGKIRLIGKQSKRKHKRAGHQVFWCGIMGSWAWRVRE